MKLKSTKLGIATVMCFTALVNAEPFGGLRDVLRMIIPVGTRKVSHYDAVVTDGATGANKLADGAKPNQLIGAWSSNGSLPMQRMDAIRCQSEAGNLPEEISQLTDCMQKILNNRERFPTRSELRKLENLIMRLNNGKFNDALAKDSGALHDPMQSLQYKLNRLLWEYEHSWNPFKFLQCKLVRRINDQLNEVGPKLLGYVLNQGDTESEPDPGLFESESAGEAISGQELHPFGLEDAHLDPEAVKLDLDQD